MAFRIQDGYTLKGRTSGKGYTESDVLPVIEFEYRPPLAKESAQFRMDQAKAQTGEELVNVRAAFVAARLAKWDVEGPTGGPAKIDAATVALLPEEVLSDLVAECLKWKPKPQEEAAGNSHSG